MADLGKLLLVLGGMIILVGTALLLAGRLPGDFVYRGKNSVFYFPIVSCILISVVLSLILWLLGRGHR